MTTEDCGTGRGSLGAIRPRPYGGMTDHARACRFAVFAPERSGDHARTRRNSRRRRVSPPGGGAANSVARSPRSLEPSPSGRRSRAALPQDDNCFAPAPDAAPLRCAAVNGSRYRETLRAPAKNSRLVTLGAVSRLRPQQQGGETCRNMQTLTSWSSDPSGWVIGTGACSSIRTAAASLAMSGTTALALGQAGRGCRFGRLGRYRVAALESVSGTSRAFPFAVSLSGSDQEFEPRRRKSKSCADHLRFLPIGSGRTGGASGRNGRRIDASNVELWSDLPRVGLSHVGRSPDVDRI